MIDHFWTMKFGRYAETIYREEWGAKYIIPVPNSLHALTVDVCMVSRDGYNWYWGHTDKGSGTGGSCCIFDKVPYQTNSGLVAFFIHELETVQANSLYLNRKIEINNERILKLQEIIKSGKIPETL